MITAAYTYKAMQCIDGLRFKEVNNCLMMIHRRESEL
jgi:hypothetical protein